MRNTIHLRYDFKGDYWGFFLYNLGWGVLSIITLGLAVPFYYVWMIKWVCKNLRIRGMIDLTKDQK